MAVAAIVISGLAAVLDVLAVFYMRKASRAYRDLARLRRERGAA